MPVAEITTYHLEMHRPDHVETAASLPEGWSIPRVEQVPLHFYRYLYEVIGRAWIWGERDHFTDEQLREVLYHPDYHCFIPYCAGYPAGVVELDLRKLPEVELKYFGLIPEWCGKGMGPVLLRWAIAQAWSAGGTRFWLHTCTDDHPGALKTYRRGGFTVFKEVTAPRPYG
ncbi:MAG: GNAT family N-acetyltransferase [Candidatus Hydrogenedentes bacterium]|nr:GNAT family N-acetyltransferase [Candidatus Hydrogenedentota bacterium]